jgi:beta-glucuronidase
VGFGNARDYSEEFQDAIYREQLPLLKAKPYVAGVIPWVFADFRDDKRVDAPIPNFNLKGLLTYDRHPKQAFKTVAEFFAQVERSREK